MSSKTEIEVFRMTPKPGSVGLFTDWEHSFMIFIPSSCHT